MDIICILYSLYRFSCYLISKIISFYFIINEDNLSLLRNDGDANADADGDYEIEKIEEEEFYREYKEKLCITTKRYVYIIVVILIIGSFVLLSGYYYYNINRIIGIPLCIDYTNSIIDEKIFKICYNGIKYGDRRAPPSLKDHMDISHDLKSEYIDEYIGQYRNRSNENMGIDGIKPVVALSKMNTYFMNIHGNILIYIKIYNVKEKKIKYQMVNLRRIKSILYNIIDEIHLRKKEKTENICVCPSFMGIDSNILFYYNNNSSNHGWQLLYNPYINVNNKVPVNNDHDEDVIETEFNTEMGLDTDINSVSDTRILTHLQKIIKDIYEQPNNGLISLQRRRRHSKTLMINTFIIRTENQYFHNNILTNSNLIKLLEEQSRLFSNYYNMDLAIKLIQNYPENIYYKIEMEEIQLLLNTESVACFVHCR
jgi:hypothetical protein